LVRIIVAFVVECGCYPSRFCNDYQRTEIGIGIVGFDVLLGVPNEYDGCNGPREGCEICEDDNRAEHREEHGEHDDSSNPRTRLGGL